MATTTIQAPGAVSENAPIESIRTHKEPLQLQGALDKYESFDVTPIIGREFPSVNLKELLEAPNSDELLRDLAITSQYSPIFISIVSLPRFWDVAQRTHLQVMSNLK
jgi:hypothetical protein